jgi:hypothetical protein
MARWIAIWLTVLSVQVFAQTSAPANNSIQQSDLKADLYFLASDVMQGRLTNTPENRLAAEFIKSRFERMGLQAAGPNESFYQPFNIITTTLGDDNRFVISNMEQPATERSLRLGQDYYPLTLSANGRTRGELVFAGFGIDAPSLAHDDYRTGSVEGKIVMILDHEPGERNPESPFDGVVTSEFARTLRKVVTAQAHGALAVLFVSDVHNHPESTNFEAVAARTWPTTSARVPRYMLETWMNKVKIPVVQISPAIANDLLRVDGASLDEFAQSAEASGGVTLRTVTGQQLDLGTAVNRHTVPDRNVVAMIKGSDPDLAHEFVIVCAHYDHNGADGTRIFNGADDDGSGTVALLEIAEAYALAAATGLRPRRSILFAAWNSEERGLLGAWAYTENPLVPLSDTVAVLNMDMIGRNEEVPVGGGGRFRGLEVQTAESNNNALNILGYTYSPDLLNEVEESNEVYGLELKMRYDNNRSNLLRRSDQWPFLQNHVPALFFHTGLHPDYHTTNDRPEKINYVKMETIARLVHQVSWNLAQTSSRPRYIK